MAVLSESSEKAKQVGRKGILEKRKLVVVLADINGRLGRRVKMAADVSVRAGVR